MANITAPTIAIRSGFPNGLTIAFDVTVPVEAAYDHTEIRYGEIKETGMSWSTSGAENSSDIIEITGLTAGKFYMFVPVAIDSSDDVISYPGNTIIATVAPNIIKMSTLEADSCALAEIHRLIEKRVTVDALEGFLSNLRDYVARAGQADSRTRTEFRRLKTQVYALHKAVTALG